MNDYCSSFVYPWYLMGLEAPMIPYANKTSSARIAMASKNAQQWEIIKGAEVPFQFTGVESMYGDYTFDTIPIDQDVIVLQVLSKYGDYYGDDYKIKDNKMYTVVYQGVEDKKIGYFEVPSYRFLSRGFGYFTKVDNKELLRKDMRIEKGTIFHHSPVKDDSLYKMGTNANTLYASWLSTDNDACMISESLADKLTVTRFYKFDIPITEEMVPLSLFGKEGEHKFFPDIGEKVGPDGLLAVLRHIKAAGMFQDYSEENLRKYHPLHDIPYRITPGATVVDVNVYTNPAKWEEIKSIENKDGELEASTSAYGQLAKYQHYLYQFYKKMISFYDENPKAKFTDKMTATLAKYALLLPGEKKHFNYEGIQFPRSRQIFNKNNIIPMCLLEIIVAVEERPGRGAKITGRHGNKGVVSAIWKDEWMPRDKWGFRADLVLHGNAIVDRMNNGQLDEHNFNRLSSLVILDSLNMPIDEAYDYIINYIMDFEPLYGELVYKQTSWRKSEYVNFCRKMKCIHLNVPVTRKNFTEEHLMAMNAKWKYRESRVVFTYPISPTRTKTCVSTYDMPIGATYIFLINKIPTANAVELGYVSQMGVPIKNPGAKLKFISQTAIRWGEDEIRIMMAAVEAKVLARLLNICGNSPQDAKEIYWKGLTSNEPCNLRRLESSDEEIAERSIPIKLTQHILASAGIDITRRAIYEDDFI